MKEKRDEREDRKGRKTGKSTERKERKELKGNEEQIAKFTKQKIFPNVFICRQRTVICSFREMELAFPLTMFTLIKVLKGH